MGKKKDFYRRRSILYLLLISLVIIVFYNIITNDRTISISRDSYDNTITDDLSEKVYKVVIDPGHGGKDRGAESVSGRFEKDFTLQMAQKVMQLANQEPQFKVYMTRTEDRFLSSLDRERPVFANDLEADVFISIHGNTFTDPDVSGTETYYYNKNSLSLAQIMHRHVVKTTSFKDRGVKKEIFFVLKDTMMPAVLLEIGYLTNPSNELMMFDDDFQDRLAASIVEGIKEYLKL